MGKKLESWRVGKLESWRVGELESWRVGEKATGIRRKEVQVMRNLTVR